MMKKSVLFLFLLGLLSQCEKSLDAYFTVEYEYYEVNETINFANMSSGAESYLWDFGDGSQSTAATPAHSYEMAGEYTVVLTVFRHSQQMSYRSTVKILEPTVIEVLVRFKGTEVVVENCDVILYGSDQDWADDTNRLATTQTNENGLAWFVSSEIDGLYLSAREYFIYASKPDDSGNGHYSNFNLWNRTNQLTQNAINTVNIDVEFYLDKKNGLPK